MPPRIMPLALLSLAALLMLSTAAAQTEPWPDFSRQMHYSIYYSPDRPATDSMVLIAPGAYEIRDVLGRAAQRETAGFYMLDFEVINKAYEEFIDATGHAAPSHSLQTEESYAFQQIFAWRGNHFPPGRAGFPVSGVSHEDAVAFCQWRTRQTGIVHRIPTLDEYLIAFSFLDESKQVRLGSPGRHWHVGPDPCYGRTEDTTTNGIRALVGNLREWMHSEFRDHPAASIGYEYSDPIPSAFPIPVHAANKDARLHMTGFRYVIPLDAAGEPQKAAE